MKRLVLSLALVVASVPALAQTGNGAPSGAHYNLNIIGVENPKNSTLTGSDRHTIFVALGKKRPEASATSNIWLTPGPFQVCDGNGFDKAYDCSGTQIGRGQNGAVFQLPCNTAVETDFGCSDGTVSASYSVWGRALGQPGGHATITTCAYDDLGTLVCSSLNTLEVFTRNGRPTFQDVTTELTTLQDVCFDDPNTTDGSTLCGDVSLFNDNLTDYFWQYDNNGLRLAQIRFYLNQ